MSVKRLTPADVVELLAGKSGLPIEQVKALLNAQAELAYAHASEGFPIPGIGIFGKVATPERKLVMRFGPKAGQEITVPAVQKLNFRLSRLARTMARRPSQPLPDLFKPVPMPDFKFSSEATELSDASMFIKDLGDPLTLKPDGKPASLVVLRLPDLSLPSGRILAADALIVGGKPFTRSVLPGRYSFALAIARLGTDERVGLAIIRFSDAPVVKWEMATREGEDIASLKEDQIFGYGVDSGTGSFCDASVQKLLADAYEEDIGVSERIIDELKATYKNTRQWVHVESPNGSLAIFSSGYGDGSYASYFGLDESGKPAALVTDFGLVTWRATRGTR